MTTVMNILRKKYGYDDIQPAMVYGKESQSIFKVTKNGMQKYIEVDPNTKDIVRKSAAFSMADDFENGTAIVYGDHFGYSLMDTDLKKKNDDYDEISRLSNGLFLVKGILGYGVINSEGAIVISCIFDKITYDEGRNKFEVFEIAD